MGRYLRFINGGKISVKMTVTIPLYLLNEQKLERINRTKGKEHSYIVRGLYSVTSLRGKRKQHGDIYEN